MSKIILVCKGNSFTSTTYTSGIGIDSIDNITIDWGDGTTESSPPNEVFSHSYSDDGYHIITITTTDNCIIGQKCFADNTSIYYVYLEDVASLNSFSFQSCTNLKKIIIPTQPTSIAHSSFQGCTNLIDITLPNNITQIPSKTFFNCSSLKQIIIPNNVTSLFEQNFVQCDNLQKIIFTNPTPPIASNTDTFTGLPTSCTIYVPKGSLSAYTNASNYPSSSTYTYMEKDMIGMEKAKIIAKTLSNRTRPVGSFYHSYTNDDPNDKFYGYWIPMENRFLLASGDTYANGSTGGEVNHTLTVEEMPSHNHWRYTAPWYVSERDLSKCDIICLTGEDANRVTKYSYNTGGSESHNNMPPYLTVNIWERIV